MAKKSKKKQHKEIWKFYLPVILAILGGLGVTGFVKLSENKITLEIEYAETAVEPTYEDKGGEYEEETHSTCNSRGENAAGNKQCLHRYLENTVVNKVNKKTHKNLRSFFNKT